MSEQSYSVNSFCEAENISRAMLYKLWRLGQGPRFYMLGNVRRISHQARIEWQAAMEAAAKDNFDFTQTADGWTRATLKIGGAK
jgi:hypothetical protein